MLPVFKSSLQVPGQQASLFNHQNLVYITHSSLSLDRTHSFLFWKNFPPTLFAEGKGLLGGALIWQQFTFH